MEKVLSVEKRENAVITVKENNYDGELGITIDVVVTYTCATCGKRVTENKMYFPFDANDKRYQTEMESWITKTSATHNCPDCLREKVEKEDREREEKKAAEKREMENKKSISRERIKKATEDGIWNNEMLNMPEPELQALEGSDKQVSWANEIRTKWVRYAKAFYRKSVIKHVGNPIANGETIDVINDGKEVVKMDLDYYNWVLTHTKAYWWINYYLKACNEEACSYTGYIRRIAASYLKAMDDANSEDWVNYYRKYYNTTERNGKDDELAKAVADESTVFPTERKHDGVAHITVTDKQVTVSYPKDNDFRAVVKGIGYRWDGTNWYKDIGETTGTAQERAAELGNKLLVAGFAICIFDPDTRKRAVEADYEPETHRWVGLSDDSKKFLLSWEYGNDRIYSSSRRIRGSRWDKPYVTVPVTEYTSVLDFAKQYSFRYTAAAQCMVDKMQGKVVAPAKEKEPVYEEHPMNEILNSSREVLEDLKDD